MNSFTSIYSRIKKTTDIYNQAMLASYLGVTRVAISNAKKREVFPAKWLLKISCDLGLDLDYLANGSPDENVEEKKPSLRKVKGDTFEERLRNARRRFGSMQELADEIGVSRQTIQTWETKAPKKANSVLLQKIADALNVSAQSLVLGVSSQEENMDGRIANETIGERIQHFRMSADLGHHDLAEKTGLRAGYIMRIEQNDIKPTADDIVLICKYLDEEALGHIMDDGIEIPMNQRKVSPEAVEREIEQLKKQIEYLKTCVE